MPGKSQRKTTHTGTDAVVAEGKTDKKDPKPKPPPPPPQGLFTDLGVKDETKEFGALSSGDRTQDIRGVIVHRTESSTMESTRNSYRTQIEKGNHTGAHFLIGKEGETSLTVPTDKVPYHVRGNKEKEYKGANQWTVGIENVGMPTKIDPDGDVRKQVEALDLPPGMRARLLAMDDKTLKATLKDCENEVHTDITGGQKRANWNLVNKLATTHGLDVGTDVRAHEHVDEKTLGEGEPITEFLGEMRQRGDKLQKLEEKLVEMAKDPEVDEAKLAQAKALLEQQKAAWTAVQADKTPQENNALAGEEIVGKGPANEREERRKQFYAQFWPQTQAINELLKPAAAATP